jgi:N-acetylmuramoyl-L-alanine amidase
MRSALPANPGVLHAKDRRAGAFFALALSLLLLGVVQGAKGSEPAAVTAIRLGVHANNTRFVADLNKVVAYTIFSLADPYRLVIDLPPMGWPLAKPVPGKRGLVAGIRYGSFRQDRGRIVLDLNGPAKVAAATLLQPRDGHGPRLVIDLAPTDRSAFLAAAGWPEAENGGAVPAKSDRSAPEHAALGPGANTKPVLVVDPGHGGIDPGAHASDGTLEKDVTLAFAKELKDMLAENGHYQVVLTRDGDEALALRSRVERARVAGAALFVSLHADALPEDPSVQGLSVYTLSGTASDAEAGALAQKENRADIIAGVDLSGEPDDVMQILIDLAQRQTMSQSEAFADDLTHMLQGRALLVKNAHRAAGFRVLKAPDVPSVLIELGYLSNASDLANLKSDAWRKSMALALCDTIDRHFAAVDERRAERAVGGSSP